MTKNKQRLWTRNEFLVVLNLYTKITYGQFNPRNSEVIKIARLLGRTPGAVAYKLVHFSGMDPYHIGRGLKGLANPGNNAIEIYNDFVSNWDLRYFESESILAQLQNISLEELFQEDLSNQIPTSAVGFTREQIIRARVNQSSFRKMVLSNFAFKCAVCRINLPGILVASHIVPWAEDDKNRLNPQNGLCLCSLHDKAYDLGYLGIKDDYTIAISPRINDYEKFDLTHTYFSQFDKKKILNPQKLSPKPEFLQIHFEKYFLK